LRVDGDYDVLPLHNKMLTWTYRSASRIKTARLGPGAGCPHTLCKLDRTLLLVVDTVKHLLYAV
jgi:hypothetical protein